MRFNVENIHKTFGYYRILKGVSFSAMPGKSVAITGRNGAGKSTLLKILCGLLRADKGHVALSLEGKKDVESRYLYRYFGLVSPYLQLYEELTAIENLRFAADLRGLKSTNQEFFNLLEMVGLQKRGDDAVKTYSSGMKQRLKYAFAYQGNPPLLFLDEPTSNLDKDGVGRVYNLMKEYKKEHILVFATNDEPDLQWADEIVDLNV